MAVGGATAWFDTAVLHNAPAGLADPVRHWWVNTVSAVVWYGTPSDPADDFSPAKGGGDTVNAGDVLVVVE